MSDDIIYIKSNLAVNNTIKLSIFNDSHEVINEYRYTINNEYTLKKANELIDSFYCEKENNCSSENYECPIPELEVLLNDLTSYEKNNLLEITFAGTTRNDELLLYGENLKSLDKRLVDDFKHIIYEDYKLYKACSNIVFRFETFKSEYFYIKLNSVFSDIIIRHINKKENLINFEFSTLIKEDREFPFDEVDFITTIDQTRSMPVILTDVKLLFMSRLKPIDQGIKPNKFIFEAKLINVTNS